MEILTIIRFLKKKIERLKIWKILNMLNICGGNLADVELLTIFQILNVLEKIVIYLYPIVPPVPVNFCYPNTQIPSNCTSVAP